jgi:hypothetical protein
VAIWSHTCLRSTCHDLLIDAMIGATSGLHPSNLGADKWEERSPTVYSEISRVRGFNAEFCCGSWNLQLSLQLTLGSGPYPLLSFQGGTVTRWEVKRRGQAMQNVGKMWAPCTWVMAFWEHNFHPCAASETFSPTLITCTLNWVTQGHMGSYFLGNIASTNTINPKNWRGQENALVIKCYGGG